MGTKTIGAKVVGIWRRLMNCEVALKAEVTAAYSFRQKQKYRKHKQAAE